MLATPDKTVDRLTDRLDEAESDLHDTKAENDRLLIENKRLKAELDAQSIQLEVDVVESRERERHRFNVKLTGLDIAGKSNQEVVTDALKLHNDNASEKDKLIDRDIYDVQIIKGRTAAGRKKLDAVIITLQQTAIKKQFYALSKKMRDQKSGIFVGDDLTVGQRTLLFELKKRTDLFTGAVIRDGAVRCFKKGGGIRRFALSARAAKTAADADIERSDG